MRIRILLHALDRTGPPMLAITFARWLARTHPSHSIDWVAFRGGDLLDAALDLGPATVLLDPRAGWDHQDPPESDRRAALERAKATGPVDVALAVSVAGGQVLPYLPSPGPPLVTWSVERGADLHWVDSPVGLRSHTTSWLAGSAGTQDELRSLLGGEVDVTLCPEFVEDVEVDVVDVDRRRRLLGVTSQSGLLVVGAGIATIRKAPDVFLELALGAARRHGPIDRFVWFGGEHDPMFTDLLAESRRLGLSHVRFMGNVVDVVPWLAAADVLAHTARLDAFPLVGLHAALVGTPVVGFSDSGGLAEMLGCGLVGAPYPDVASLLDALDGLRDSHARSRVASEQRAAVVERFTAQTAAPKLLEHLERVADGEPSGPS